MYMNIKNRISLFLILIVLLASFLRIYKLDKVPASLNWDEIDAGYNAYTIANWARDEWGQFMPLIFTSFKDDKHPVHIYVTAPFVKLFGLSDFVTRFPSAAVGILSVLTVFFVSYALFKNYLAALFAALFLAVSPYHLQFSRGLWESNFALFFFLLGLMFFYRALEKNGKILNLSFLSFGISLFSYHSSKIVVLPMVVLLIILYFKDLKKLTLNFYFSLAILLIFVVLLILNPRLTGLARVKQTQFGQTEIEKTQTYQKTKIAAFGLAEITFKGMMAHFTTDYLFFKGDQTPRNSVKVFGQFYKIDALFMLIGIISLLWLKSRVTILMLAWLFISPIPASIVIGAPNANRAIFMLGGLNLITALGVSSFVRLFKGRVRKTILGGILLIIAIEAFFFLNYYFNTYPKKDPHDWVYGMKQITDFVRENDDRYDQIFMTDIRSQPYIYFLYYLKIPLPEFIGRVFYNNTESKSYSTVSNFGKYYFGGWDTVESMPNQRVLYILSPSQYDGLRHRAEFDVKKIVYYSDGSTAFFIVSAK